MFNLLGSFYEPDLDAARLINCGYEQQSNSETPTPNRGNLSQVGCIARTRIVHITRLPPVVQHQLSHSKTQTPTR